MCQPLLLARLNRLVSSARRCVEISARCRGPADDVAIRLRISHRIGHGHPRREIAAALAYRQYFGVPAQYRQAAFPARRRGRLHGRAMSLRR